MRLSQIVEQNRARLYTGKPMTTRTLFAILTCALALTTIADDGLIKVVVYDPNPLGYTSCRIPGLVVTPRGTLLAYCEARRNKGGDWDPIDVLLRRSADAGQTWSAPQTLVSGGDKTTSNNPVAIVDREGGVIHFLYCTDYARCFYRKSTVPFGRTVKSLPKTWPPSRQPTVTGWPALSVAN